MSNALNIWIWFCAYLNVAGWALSAVHELNAAGYVAALALWVVSLLIGKKIFVATGSPVSNRVRLRRYFNRFKRPFPLIFLILSFMAFLGGAVHPPNNYDALAYRLPRVLHWLEAGQWHWIHTAFPRLNDRAPGIEWVSAPFLALFKSTRPLFLINFISFLFLPGLFFSLLTRLGVRGRVAWPWMWIASSGYCFLLEAGGISNDSFAALFSLAAIDFALRLKTSRCARDLFFSILAAAMLTAVKTSGVPLLLPWAMALLPSVKVALRWPWVLSLACALAVFASFLPTAVFNQRFSGDWSGLAAESLKPHGSLVLRTTANVALVAMSNLLPPVFPEADQWNRWVQKTLPLDLNQRLHQTLTEPPAAEFKAVQMQTEENAGLGLGVTVLLLASALIALLRSSRPSFPRCGSSPETLWRMAVIISPWISAGALLTQSDVYAIGRILAPYYPLLLPLLLEFPGHKELVKKAGWRLAAFVVFAMAGVLLIICPARPLFPAETILEKIQAHHPDSKLVARAREVYSVYEDRNDAFAPALEALPPGLKVLGFISYDDPETSLWVPFGARSIDHVCAGDSAAEMKARGIQYILAKGNLFGTQFPPLDQWLTKTNARVVRKIELNLRASSGQSAWYLIELN